MRCPKCGFISFDQQPSCTKCNADLSAAAPTLTGTGERVTAPFFLGAILNEGAGLATGGVATAPEETVETAAPPEVKEGTAALFEALEAESQDLAMAPEAPPEEAGEELDLSFAEPPEEAEVELSLNLEEEAATEEAPALELGEEGPPTPQEAEEPELVVTLEEEETAAPEVQLAAEPELELTLEEPEVEPPLETEAPPTKSEVEAKGEPAETVAPSLSLHEIDLSDLVEKKGSTAQSISVSEEDDIFDLSALIGGSEEEEESHRGGNDDLAMEVDSDAASANRQDTEELNLELDLGDETAPPVAPPGKKTKSTADASGLTLESDDQ